MLPSGFVAVPFPCTSATPTTPLKSVIEDGSTPGPKKVRWKSTPFTVVIADVGRGGGAENGAAEAALGQASPLPAEAIAVAAAVPPIKARRESKC